ncbi:MAG: HAD-IB family hydrolase [Candidatus Parcubacteria bacterium]|nr:HAD-IB family hydrolase [Candidatus Parcubacteria bacterium]
MKELVIFDVDNTIIKGQSQRLLLEYVFKKRLIKFFYYLKILCWFILYKLGIAKNPKKTMEYAFGFLKDKDENYLKNIIDDFFESELKKHFYKEALDLIDKHKRNGQEIILISNAIEPIIMRIAQYLGIKDYIATKLEIQNGKFTGKLFGEIVYGKNKIDKIREFIKKNNFSLKNSWSYGDHITDLPVLKIASHPIAVNPDKILFKEASKKHWPVLNFKNLLVK